MPTRSYAQQKRLRSRWTSEELSIAESLNWMDPSEVHAASILTGRSAMAVVMKAKRTQGYLPDHQSHPRDGSRKFRLQDMSLGGENHLTPWTVSETASAMEMYHRGDSLQSIASSLGRTLRAVESEIKDRVKEEQAHV